MNRKHYWGLGVLILIIGVVGVFVMLQPDPDREPEKRFIVPTEAELKKAKETKQPPPGASPNGHWHNGEWHDESHQPIVKGSQETPSENLKAQGKTDLSKYEGKLSGEEFYRDRFSREELESMIKSDQRSVESIKTKRIPHLEKLREKKLKFLQSLPDNLHGPTKEGLADVERQLKFQKFQLSNYEKGISEMLKVLNEESNNVEK